MIHDFALVATGFSSRSGVMMPTQLSNPMLVKVDRLRLPPMSQYLSGLHILHIPHGNVEVDDRSHAF